MKYLILVSVGILGSFSVGAEIWEKPKYVPDEGHLQEEIERQEEKPKEKLKEREKHHQDVKKPRSSPKLKKTEHKSIRGP